MTWVWEPCKIFAMSPVTDPLRKAIRQSGESMLGLQRKTGVARQCIRAFVNGTLRLRSDNVDALAHYLKLELRPKADKGD